MARGKFLGVQRAFVVGISGLEALLDHRGIFILADRAVFVAIRSGEILAGQMLSQFLFETKGVVDIFGAAGIEKPDISILDDKFLEQFKSHEQENLRLKLLAKILADEIRTREKSNLAKPPRGKGLQDHC